MVPSAAGSGSIADSLLLFPCSVPKASRSAVWAPKKCDRKTTLASDEKRKCQRRLDPHPKSFLLDSVEHLP